MNSFYKQGSNRNQQLLFPPSIDNYIDKDNSVRAIEAHVELLDTPKGVKRKTTPCIIEKF